MGGNEWRKKLKRMSDLVPDTRELLVDTHIQQTAPRIGTRWRPQLSLERFNPDSGDGNRKITH